MRTVFIALFLAPLLHAGPPGFASLEGETSGGGELKPVIVHTAKELQEAVERSDEKAERRDSSPRVIRLAGDIDLGELANGKPGHDLKKVGVIHPRSNTTIEGPPEGATLKCGTIELKDAENVIIRNLRFRGLWENDPSGEYDEMGWDYVQISGSRHVWVDHCDFGRVYDGQLDVIHGADLVTISHCVFAGEGGEPHKKCMLIGNSSSDKAREQDRGHLNVTIQECWFRDLVSRAPRLRSGNVHFLNNLVENVSHATLSLCGGVTLVEGSVYRDCKLPTSFSYADDTVEKGRGGSIRIVDSLDLGKNAGGRFQDHPEKFSFNEPVGFAWENLSKPPYPYQALPSSAVEERVKREAGPQAP